jgi:hypothetical protein
VITGISQVMPPRKSFEFLGELYRVSVIAAFVAAIWLSNFFLIPLMFSGDGESNTNASDMFGSINALFFLGLPSLG